MTFHDPDIARLAEVGRRLGATMQYGASSNPPSASSLPSQNSAAGSGSAGLSFFGQLPTNAPSLTGGAAGAPTPIYPSSSLSPYYLGQIGGDPITMGAGLAGGGQMSVNQAIQWFDTLPPSELEYWEGQLLAGGFYTDANGNPLKTAPVLGALDDQGRRAFINVLIQAFSQGASVTDTINNAIQSGAGAGLRSNLPSAVLGGGNVYSIDLLAPGAVNQVANTIFQAALGRNATGSETAAITAAVNSGAIAQALTKEQGAETESVQTYQARVNQRNIQYQYETNPKTIAPPGGVPSGDINSSAQYATALLQYMDLPVTVSNVQFVMGWVAAQGGGLSNKNPLGSQNAVPGSAPGQTPGAPAIPAYTSWAQSLQATAAALQTGYYGNIMAALKAGNAGSAAGDAQVKAELGKWSGGQYTDITGQANAAQGAAQAQTKVVYQQAGWTGPPAGAQGAGGTISQAQAAQMPGYEAFIKGGGTPAQWIAQLQSGQTAQPTTGQGTAQSTGAEGGGPQNPPTVPGYALSPGQQQTNPGDVYINPMTVYTQQPLSPEEASYLQATTGANRFGFGENNYLNAFLATMDMIAKGAPTG